MGRIGRVRAYSEVVRKSSAPVMRTLRFLRCCLPVLALCAGRTLAQVGLPQVQLPPLPVQTPVDLNRTLDQTLKATSPGQLRQVRQLRVRELLRSNRSVLEADPRGAPVIRSEIVALAPTLSALQQAQAAGFDIVRRRALEGLDMEMVVLRAPAGMSTTRALRNLRKVDPEGVYDFNHLYMETGEVVAEPAASVSPAAAVRASRSHIKVGLIDGGVDRSHPAFRHVNVQEHGCDVPAASSHGTAVASLLVGTDEGFRGAAPGATLYAADVYCRAVTGGAVDAVADALAWLSREQVPVINVSLVGPANRTLEQVVRVVLARGHLVVAAVGNDGPGAPPLYPAAYPGVVGVTAVDARDRVLMEACRGTQVAFAAPGADMSAAALEHRYIAVRGTSFAAPIVAGLLAEQLSMPDRIRAEAARELLVTQAIDLGSKGPDRIYGHGLVGSERRNALAATKGE